MRKINRKDRETNNGEDENMCRDREKLMKLTERGEPNSKEQQQQQKKKKKKIVR